MFAFVQGLECRLSDIVPANDAVDWSQESSDRFFELVGDEQLQMLVRCFAVKLDYYCFPSCLG